MGILFKERRIPELNALFDGTDEHARVGLEVQRQFGLGAGMGQFGSSLSFESGITGDVKAFVGWPRVTGGVGGKSQFLDSNLTLEIINFVLMRELPGPVFRRPSRPRTPASPDSAVGFPGVIPAHGAKPRVRPRSFLL